MKEWSREKKENTTGELENKNELLRGHTYIWRLKNIYMPSRNKPFL
jgi:hypothetical protein